jgi:hypothetical protein
VRVHSLSQGTRVAATTDTRRFGRALRPLLLLGGFVVLWWCLATGTAQADDGAHDLGKATRGLAGTVERAAHQPGRNAAGPAHRATHSTAPKLAHTGRQHAASAVSPVDSPAVRTVESTVRTSPVKPQLDAATTALRTEVVPVLEQTRQTVDMTVLGISVIPELEGLETVGDSLPLVAGSSTLQGETPSKQAARAHSAARATTAVDTTSLTGLTGPSAAAVESQDRVVHGSPVGAPWDDHALGAFGGAGAVSTLSSSGAGAAFRHAAPVMGPDTAKTLISSLADRHPAGPAYQPSSSPD